MLQVGGNSFPEQERSSLLGSLRRGLSVVAVRAQAKCLLSRLGHLGVGASLAAERRKTIKNKVEVEKKEMQAYYEAYIRGKCAHIRGNLHP